MRPPIHERFVDKAAAAITAAVEVYNKPAFMQREETFAILALNAWEPLLINLEFQISRSVGRTDSRLLAIRKARNNLIDTKKPHPLSRIFKKYARYQTQKCILARLRCLNIDH